MANHTNLPNYPYPAKAPFPHGDANDASEKIVKSPNFDEGSAHAPSADIELSGSLGGGFSFADSFPFRGGLLIPEGETLAFGSAGAGGSITTSELVSLWVSGTITLTNGATKQAKLHLAAYSRVAMHKTRIPGTATVNAMTQGPIVILGKPTGAQTLTLAQASDTNLDDDDYFEIYMPKPGNDPASDYWIIKREGSANNIAIMWGKYLPSAGAGDAYPAYCRVHVEGGVWRLTGGAGINYDTDA